MTEPPPPLRSPDYAPHDVTQDSPFKGHDNDPISLPRMKDMTIGLQQTQRGSSPCPGATMID